ncbi:hypothetical protein SS05631_c22590 [Sinorhizobium sp. CCBAU 05631]|nr:hypothetical protein SS05631_c22590 [Sinorhizobium sp. CCBAU 05631]
MPPGQWHRALSKNISPERDTYPAAPWISEWSKDRSSTAARGVAARASRQFSMLLTLPQ